MALNESNYGYIRISLGDKRIFETKGEEKKIFRELKEFIYKKA